MKSNFILGLVSFGLVLAIICFTLLAVSLKSLLILLATFVVGFLLTLGSLHISNLVGQEYQEGV